VCYNGFAVTKELAARRMSQPMRWDFGLMAHCHKPPDIKTEPILNDTGTSRIRIGSHIGAKGGARFLN
jgi:hypothetical protein